MNDTTTNLTTLECSLDERTTKEEIERLIDKLDNRYSLHFFDHHHEQISEPGAYVTVHHDEAQLTYELSNQGWASDWKAITKDELIDYIYHNREYNEGKIEMRSRLKGNGIEQTKDGSEFMSYFYNIDDKKEA